MRKVINGKRYDTEKAELLMSWNNGYSTRDFKCRGTDVYRTASGKYFRFDFGGAKTDMAESYGNSLGWGEDVTPLSDEEARELLEKHSDMTDAEDSLKKYFSEVIKDA